MDRLTGQVALITGAGSGMGRAVSQMFVQEGAAVVLVDNQAEPLAETVAWIKEAGGQVESAVCDVSDENSVNRAVAAGIRRFGKLTVIYNNAGIMPEQDHSVLDTDPEVWDWVQDVNLKGVYLVCKYGIPALLEAGGGSVINVASFVALVGCTVPQDSYTASKGGVIALTRSMAAQFGSRGVRVNAICPGPIETPLLMDWLLTDPDAKSLRLSRIPLGRFGKPEDIGYLAIYLASPESAWMTGAALNIDGGITSYYF